MFIKITTENIRSIRYGDYIIKYPKDGEPVDVIDITDTKNMDRFRVSEKPPFNNMLPIAFDWEEVKQDLVALPYTKSFTEIVNEGIWWHKPFKYYFRVTFNVFSDSHIVGSATFKSNSRDPKDDQRNKLINDISNAIRQKYPTKNISLMHHKTEKITEEEASMLSDTYNVDFNIPF